MNNNIIAIIIQEGSRFITQYLRTRPRQQGLPEPAPPEIKIIEDTETTVEATAIPTGCVPCALGHFGTCNGLLNEGMRFARSDGLQSKEVIDRINHCLDELNSMEREDLTSEKIINLPPAEKGIAIKALAASRATRHFLEDLTTVDDLERATATTQTTRTEIGREWYQYKLSNAKIKEEDQSG